MVSHLLLLALIASCHRCCFSYSYFSKHYSNVITKHFGLESYYIKSFNSFMGFTEIKTEKAMYSSIIDTLKDVTLLDEESVHLERKIFIKKNIEDMRDFDCTCSSSCLLTQSLYTLQDQTQQDIANSDFYRECGKILSIMICFMITENVFTEVQCRSLSKLSKFKFSSENLNIFEECISDLLHSNSAITRSCASVERLELSHIVDLLGLSACWILYANLDNDYDERIFLRPDDGILNDITEVQLSRFMYENQIKVAIELLRSYSLGDFVLTSSSDDSESSLIRSIINVLTNTVLRASTCNIT